MKLEEAMKKATPGPLSAQNILKILSVGPDSWADHTQDKANAALLAHWYNVGPQCYNALRLWKECADEHETLCTCGRETMQRAIEAAEEVEGI